MKKSITIALCCCVMLAFFSSFQINANTLSSYSDNQVAGFVDGDFNVNNNGAASYAIKIKIPQGTAGMQPDLKLIYNNQGGDGLVGVGWSIGGLSSVARCPKTFALDGVKSGINFDANDRFCIDGMRLVAVQGEYGAPGTQYRTELEQWTRYYSYGNCGNGPCYFSARAKDGSNTTYGNTVDSRILASGKNEVRIWAVDKREDLNSNFIAVTYANNAANGSYYPIKIAYTGNNKTSLIPGRSVQFDYDTNRPDSTVSYVAGSMVQNNARLIGVSSYVDGALVKKYNINYIISDQTSQSLVSSIAECASDGSCLAPTTFSWNNVFTSNHAFDYQDWGQGAVYQKGAVQSLGDFNADGTTDIGYIYNNSGKVNVDVYISDGKKFDRQSWYSGTKSWATGQFVSGDYNGDGISDIASVYNNSGYISIDSYISNGSAFTQHTAYLSNEPYDQKAQVLSGDINGDGIADIVYAFNDSGKIGVNVYLGQANSFTKSATLSVSSGTWRNEGSLHTGDFNHDGLTDLAYVYNDAGKVGVNLYLSDGAALRQTNVQIPDLAWMNDALFSFSDYNGDGKTDISYFFNNSGKVSAQVLISQGDKFLSTRWLDSDIVWGGVKIVKSSDYNGDSKVDVAYVYRGEHDKVNIDSFLSTGKSFTKFNSIQSQGDWGDEQFIPSDFNADGLADIVNTFNKSGNLGFTMYTSKDGSGPSFSLKQSDLLNGIETGAKQTISIEYKPLTFSGIYKKAQSATYPTVDVQIPYYVVAKHRVYEPVSNTSAVSEYSFEGARVDLQGRGWQGFSAMKVRNTSVSDLSLQTDTLKTYYQDFPQTGLLKDQRISRVSDGLTLWETHYAYGNTPSGQSSAVKIVYKTEKDVSNYSNGTLNYTLTEKYYYDDAHSVITRTDYLNSDGGNYSHCSQYLKAANDDSWWYAFYQRADKVVNTIDGCSVPDFSVWNAKTDLRFYQYAYDNNLNMISLSQWNDQRAEFATNRSDYDDYGNVIGRTDAMGNKTLYAYDDTYHTFLATTTSPSPRAGSDPLIAKTTYEPKFGILIKQDDANNNTVMAVPADGLDVFGRVIKQNTIQPDNTGLVTTTVRSYTFGDTAGINIKQALRDDWNENNISLWFWETKYYDALGRIYQHTSKGPSSDKNIISHTGYNAQGLKNSESLPYYTGEPASYTEYQYDIKKRIISTLYPTGAVQSVFYHTNDNRIADSISPDPAGTATAKDTVTTRVTVDNDGNKIESVAPNAGITTYRYDVLGQKLAQTDPSGEETTYVYTSLGLISQMSDPERGITTYTYNNAGKPDSVVNGLGEKTQFSYDALLRMTQIAYFSNDGKLAKTIVKTYDTAPNGKGLLATIVTPDVSYRFSYFYNGKIAAKTVTLNVAGASTDYTTRFSYDPLGRLTGSGLPDGSSVASGFWPTGATKILTYTDPSGATKKVVTYNAYDAMGDLVQASFENGVVAHYGHDVFGRLTSDQLVLGDITLRNFAYQWNLANKILAITDQRISPAPSLSQQLRYNKMGFLVASAGVYGDIAYQYNVSGDITAENNAVYSYDATKKHQLVSGCLTENLACNNVLTLAYNDIGNVTGKTAVSGDQSTDWSYRYDAADNLAQVTRRINSGASADMGLYTYGSDRWRIGKINGDGNTIHYISPNYIVSVDAAGVQSVDKYLATEHGTVAQVAAAYTGYFHLNNVNSSMLVTSDTGAQTDRVSYKPFGSIDKANSSLKTPFIPKFTGKELDGDSDLYYFGARYYDSSINRFMAPDPARQFASPYAYGNNDPMIYTDPDGQVFGIDDAIEIAIIAEIATDVAVETAAAATTAAVATGEATSAIGLAVETEAEVSAIASAASIDATGVGVEAAQAEVTTAISTESIVSGSQTLSVSTGIDIATQTEATETVAQSFAESAMDDDSLSSLESEEGLGREGGDADRPGNSVQQIRNRPRNDIRVHHFDNHRVYTATGRISASGVRSALMDTASNDDVLIFSGTHGNAYGETAAEDASLEELRFAQEDVATARSVGGRGAIHIGDVGSTRQNIASWEITEAVQTGVYRGRQYDCVIGGFCYSEVRYNLIQGRADDVIGGFTMH